MLSKPCAKHISDGPSDDHTPVAGQLASVVIKPTKLKSNTYPRSGFISGQQPLEIIFHLRGVEQ
jgi:hypothetical protein